MSAWNFSVLVDAIARSAPDRVAVVHGTARTSWLQLASRARSLAWYLHADGRVAPGDKVAIVLPNCTEYLESFIAARKLLCVPLNIGTERSAEAIDKLIDQTDAKAVIHSPEMATKVHGSVRRIPKRWRPLTIEVGEAYQRAITTATAPSEWEIETPSADDLLFLAGIDLEAMAVTDGSTLLAAAPLVQGKCLPAALDVLRRGGRVAFADSPRFDPHVVWRTVDEAQVTILAIAGDAFARPLLAALGRTEGRYSLASLQTLSSSGTQLSLDVTRALEIALPDVRILDTGTARAESVSGRAKMVQPSAVETRLLKHASVFDCVVVGVSDPRVGKHVVALIQVAENHYLDEPELAAWCRAHVPSTMTPGRFVFVEDTKRTPSGGVDYATLRNVAIERLLEKS